ncbi:MAG: hypothetical protein Faunusvirus8_32 [Faunusvirus sp.]|jgi:hypothetical protein|uniref:Uncharacterized protein n=1 Tax=Faunusvirus sp. TaxID=2487766 RepID=A0A3G4ZWQ4_9VIRU|nr:MAG: hypothetical protein Faunusvirus8_32 [Faunusvirus sp.]
MSYTVTDVPLKIATIHSKTKQKCELHKFADGTEFMMYTITGKKYTSQFVFDSEDFDIIDGKIWRQYRNNVISHHAANYLYYLSTYIRDKYITTCNKQLEFKNIENNDYRKI